MFIVVELLGLFVLFVAVWVLWRLAATRPEQPGLRTAARVAAVTYAVFLIVSLVDFDYIADNSGTVLGNIALVSILVLTIGGYRWLLRRARDRSHPPE